MLGVYALDFMTSMKHLDVPFPQLEERCLNKAKAHIPGNCHQDKEDNRPETCQIEIGNIHDLLIHKPGCVKHHEEVKKIDGV